MSARFRMGLPAAILLTLAGCAASDSPPRSRVAPREAPKRARRPAPSPLELSDLMVGVLTQLEKMQEVFLKGLVPVMSRAANRPTHKDVLATVVDIRRAVRSHRKAYLSLVRRKGSEAPALRRSFESYLDLMERRFFGVAGALKLLYDPSLSQGQAFQQFHRRVAPNNQTNKRVVPALKERLCQFVKSHGVVRGDARFKICPRGDRWLQVARALEQAACACADAACAKQQQQALYDFIKNTKGVKVGRGVGQKVANAVLRAQSCIVKKQHTNAPRSVPGKRP